jgi:hypothetical protein
MTPKLTLSRLLLFSLVLFIALGQNALASITWYVDGVHGSDTHNGRSPAAAYKTIRYAISRSVSGDSIRVASATYTENLSIGVNLTIVGASAWTTIIDGGHSGTAVAITSAGAHVSLSQLTIRNGSGKTHGGGGIYNLGLLTITNGTISGNGSDDTVAAGGGLGGGIYNSGTLTVVQSSVTGNSVSRFRMGASAFGGGIYNTGRLTLTNSTVSANQAVDFWPAGVAYGGGIATAGGTVAINNGTISLNSAIIHTPVGSAGTFGGGIYNKSGAATLQNSVVANNTYGGNCNGSVASHGHNLSSDLTCHFNGAGDQSNNNPKLGALQNNGGFTKTMALLAGSPATDAGNPSGCTDGNGHRLTVDQRGHSRPTISACDIGAYNH